MLEIITTKKCSQCKIEKQLSSFSKDSRLKSGLCSKCKQCDKEYHEKNKEKSSLIKKKYYKQHREKIILRSKMRDKQTISLWHKNNYKNNKDKILERCKKYRHENKEKIYIQKKAYQQTEIYKAVRRNIMHNRRVKINTGNVTSKEIMNLEKSTKRCYWCNCLLNNLSSHLDHYIPLSKGGEHSLENLVISCPSCNMSKGAKGPLEFANKLGRLL